jgi:hypothetical protein
VEIYQYSRGKDLSILNIVGTEEELICLAMFLMDAVADGKREFTIESTRCMVRCEQESSKAS